MGNGRTYRELQADGERQLEAGASSSTPATPAGLPDRAPVERRTRRHQLEATAARLGHAIRRDVTDTTFELWLGPLVLDDAAAGALFLGAPGPIAGWVRDRFAGVLDRAATDLAGHPMRCHVYVAPDAGATATLAELIHRHPENGCAPASTRRPDASAPAQPSPAAGIQERQ